MRLWERPPLRARDARKEFADLVALCGLPPGSYTVRADDSGTSISFSSSGPAQTQRWERQLARAYELVVTDRQAQPKILFDNLRAGTNGARGGADDFVSLAPGLFAGLAPAALLARRLDALLLRRGLAQGATEVAVPHLIPWETLRRARYNAAHPEHLTACQAVRRDLDAVEAMAAAESLQDAVGFMDPEPACLTPAACYHVYPILADSTVGPQRLVTVVASCTRRESVWTPRPIRLWAFRMRELVMVGSAARVREFRDRQLTALGDLARQMGLPCQVTTASDPFFTTNRRGQKALQHMLDLKHELVARDSDGNDFAVASVNLHRDTFGRAFGITADGQPAHSACFAVGLDRFAYWVLSHRGPEPANWPEPLRTDQGESTVDDSGARS